MQRKPVSTLLLLPLLLTAACSGGSRNEAGTPSAAPSVTASAQAAPAASLTPAPSPSPADPLMEQVKAMSLEQKLGQMVIAGIAGTALDENSRRLITENHIGGFILYKPNIESAGQTVALLNSLKEANKSSSIPLLLSVDQEGGKVARLPAEITAIPSSRVIAKSGSKARARAIGEAIGEELQAFGFNLDFAPVLDIDSNPDNPVIGDRSFGPTASIVQDFGLEEMHGLQAKKVIPVVKHFPGHGDTSVDSHLELPVVNKSAEELKKLELLPFSAAVGSKADAVMVAHILLPKLDPDNPATMSKAVIGDLLRQELGFNGVVITDDMTMGAIMKHYDLGTAAVQSVQAGSDIVLVAHDYALAVQVLGSLKQAVGAGKVSTAQIDKSVYRILALKQKYALADKPAGSVDVKGLNAVIQKALNAK